MPSARSGWATGFSLSRPLRNYSKILRILSWASAPLQRPAKHRAAALSFWFSRNPTPGLHQTPTSSASLEVSTPSALSRAEQRLCLARFTFPTACAFRSSQPRGTFFRSEPAGLISCRIRSWGHPPEHCSSDAAVRCFQRLSPLDVSFRLQGLAPRQSPPLGPAV